MREPLKLVLSKTANIDFGFSFVGCGVALGDSVGLGVAPGVSFTSGDLVGSTVGPGVCMIEVLGCGVGDESFAKRSSPLRVNSHAIRTPETARTTTIAKTQGKVFFRIGSRSESPARLTT